jgi:hypothetical protein
MPGFFLNSCLLLTVRRSKINRYVENLKVAQQKPAGLRAGKGKAH